MTISIKDIARKANVSVMTVYRALHDYPDINPDTKKRILELAKELRYRPNLLAKSLIQKKTNTIGLIVPAINNPYYASQIYYIDHLLAESNRSLLLAISHNSLEQQSKNIFEVRSRMVDGLIIIPMHQQIPKEELLEMAEEEFPLVVLGEILDIPVSFVTVHLEQGGYDATNYLISLGHRRIAHISLPRLTPPDGRLVGYRRALKENRIRARRNYVIDCENTTQAGFAIVEHLLGLKPCPTAVFVYNDNVAIGVLNGLLRAGVRVPAEMSVMGFDDVALSAMLPVSLTTVGQFIEKEATELVNLLSKQLIKGTPPSKPVRKYIPTELIVRASTAPPPAGA